MPHAFSTLVRVDLVNGGAEKNRLVGALGLADITVDALIGNDQGHGMSHCLAVALRTAAPDYQRPRFPVTRPMVSVRPALALSLLSLPAG
jgi:hypothetical protein